MSQQEMNNDEDLSVNAPRTPPTRLPNRKTSLRTMLITTNLDTSPASRIRETASPSMHYTNSANSSPRPRSFGANGKTNSCDSMDIQTHSEHILRNGIDMRRLTLRSSNMDDPRDSSDLGNESSTLDSPRFKSARVRYERADSSGDSSSSTVDEVSPMTPDRNDTDTEDEDMWSRRALHRLTHGGISIPKSESNTASAHHAGAPKSDGLNNQLLSHSQLHLEIGNLNNTTLCNNQQSFSLPHCMMDASARINHNSSSSNGGVREAVDEETKAIVRRELTNVHLFGSSAAIDADEVDMCLNENFQGHIVTGEPGQVVVKQGDHGDTMFVVIDGKLQATAMKRKGDNVDARKSMGTSNKRPSMNWPGSGESVKLTMYNGSGVFGELALMYNCRRSATVTAVTRCKLFALPRTMFRRVLRAVTEHRHAQAIAALELVPEFEFISQSDKSTVAAAMHKISLTRGTLLVGGATRTSAIDKSSVGCMGDINMTREQGLRMGEQEQQCTVDSPDVCLFLLANGAVMCTSVAKNISLPISDTLGQAMHVDSLDIKKPALYGMQPDNIQQQQQQQQQPHQHQHKVIHAGSLFVGASMAATMHQHGMKPLLECCNVGHVSVISENGTCFALARRYIRTAIPILNRSVRTSLVVQALANVEVLAGIGTAELVELATSGDRMTFAQGETIEHEADCLWLITTGVVQLENKHDIQRECNDMKSRSTRGDICVREVVRRMTVGEVFGGVVSNGQSITTTSAGDNCAFMCEHPSSSLQLDALGSPVQPFVSMNTGTDTIHGVVPVTFVALSACVKVLKLKLPSSLVSKVSSKLARQLTETQCHSGGGAAADAIDDDVVVGAFSQELVGLSLQHEDDHFNSSNNNNNNNNNNSNNNCNKTGHTIDIYIGPNDDLREQRNSSKQSKKEKREKIERAGAGANITNTSDSLLTPHVSSLAALTLTKHKLAYMSPHGSRQREVRMGVPATSSDNDGIAQRDAVMATFEQQLWQSRNLPHTEGVDRSSDVVKKSNKSDNSKMRVEEEEQQQQQQQQHQRQQQLQPQPQQQQQYVPMHDERQLHAEVNNRGSSHPQPQHGWRTNDHGSVSSIHDLIFVAQLGRGAFGTVTLVRHEHSGFMYALKKMKKKQIRANNQEAHVHNERDVLELVSMGYKRNTFITNLIRTFKDHSAVYLLLGAALGGDLFTCLSSLKRFEPHEVRFVFSQVVLALQHLHSHQVVFRDVKPENCVMTQLGYVKLTDFGVAKRLDRDGYTYTLCGTPAYLAPEVFRMRGHGLGVDSWALGVLLFELVVGAMPFQGHDMRTLGDEMHAYELWHSRPSSLRQALLLQNAATSANKTNSPSHVSDASGEEGGKDRVCAESLKTEGCHPLFQAMIDANASADCIALLFVLLHPDYVQRIRLATTSPNTKPTIILDPLQTTTGLAGLVEQGSINITETGQMEGEQQHDDWEGATEMTVTMHKFFTGHVDWSALKEGRVPAPERIARHANERYNKLVSSAARQRSRNEGVLATKGKSTEIRNTCTTSDTDGKWVDSVPLIGIPAPKWDEDF